MCTPVCKHCQNDRALWIWMACSNRSMDSDTKYFKPPIFHCRPIVHSDYDHPYDGGFNLYFVPVWYQALYFQIQSFPLNNKESQSINVTGKENLFIGIKICANSISKV